MLLNNLVTNSYRCRKLFCIYILKAWPDIKLKYKRHGYHLNGNFSEEKTVTIKLCTIHLQDDTGRATHCTWSWWVGSSVQDSGRWRCVDWRGWDNILVWDTPDDRTVLSGRMSYRCPPSHGNSCPCTCTHITCSSRGHHMVLLGITLNHKSLLKPCCVLCYTFIKQRQCVPRLSLINML